MAEGASHSSMDAADDDDLAEPLGEVLVTELLSRGEPAQPALIVADSGQALTYAQIAARIDTLAQRLAGRRARAADPASVARPEGPVDALLLRPRDALGA